VGDGAPRTFEVERLVWDQGSGFPDLAGFRLIVLANVGRFSTRDADRLKGFVDQGGNVLWFVGERTTNAVLGPISKAGLIGSTKFLPAIDTTANVTDFDRKHPALAPFSDPQHGDLRALGTRRLVPIESLDPNATILLRSRRWPLIISHEAGNGHIVLVMTSADRSWSDWPQSRLFVPLVRQFAAWLTGQLDARQSVVFETIKDASVSPGIEEVSNSLIVRNVDPTESEIGRFGDEQFRKAVQLPEQAIVGDEVDLVQQFAPAGVARSDEKWPFVVWMLLGILGAELLLASRVHE